MLRNKRESIEWLEFEIFQEFPQIGHAIFLRHGGVSAAPYLGLNVGGGTGDNPQHIQQNRTLLLKLMGCKAFAGSYQVHGADVRQAPLENPDEKCDGLYTAKEGLGLFIKLGDLYGANVGQFFLQLQNKVFSNDLRNKVPCGSIRHKITFRPDAIFLSAFW